MTSYEFEVAAKNSVIDVLKKEYKLDVSITDLEMVWFAHILGFKKCTIWGKPMKAKYAEVTYNKNMEEIYVDIYIKDFNMKYFADEIDTSVNKIP